MKKSLAVLLVCMVIVSGGCMPTKANVYETETFKVNYPADWTMEEDGDGFSGVGFIGGDENSFPLFNLNPMTSFALLGWKEVKGETYMGEQGIEWTISYNGKDNEWIAEYGDDWWDQYEDSYRFVTVSAGEISFEGFVLYTYDESVNLNAEEELKEILDSWEEL